MSEPGLPPRLVQLLAELRSFGLSGAWLLADCEPFVSYDFPSDTSTSLSDLAACSPLASLFDDEETTAPHALDLCDVRWLLVLSLDERAGLVAPPGLTTLISQAGYCRICGCSHSNPCETPDGPCAWLAPDLCSACVQHSLLPSLLNSSHPDLEAL